MKQFKPKPELYSIRELIVFDSCLFDLYQDERPYFFIQLLMEKLNNELENKKFDSHPDDLLLAMSHIS